MVIIDADEWDNKVLPEMMSSIANVAHTFNLRIAERQVLIKMLENINEKVTLLSKESINCKRYNRVTHKYNDILVDINADIQQFEQQILLILLTMG